MLMDNLFSEYKYKNICTLLPSANLQTNNPRSVQNLS